MKTKQIITFIENSTKREIIVKKGLTQNTIEIDLGLLTKRDLLFIAKQFIKLAADCLAVNYLKH